MYGLVSGSFPVRFLFLKVMAFISLFIISGVTCMVSKSYAESPRLAVLELQGDLGTLAQRQAWTDGIRRRALTLLRDHGVMVIDRDQFAQLVDPSRDLSDCVGLCAAAIAREVGAHWSLSGSLTQDGSNALVTLKLHNAMGSLLGVEQIRGVLLKVTQQELAPMTERLIKSALFSPDEDEDDAVETSGHEEAVAVDSNPSDQKSEPEPWQLVNTEKGQHCVSPLITIAEYQQCVQAGVCNQTATWGTCQGDQHSPVRCINLKQALTFSRWKKGWIPSLKEWSMVMGQRHRGSTFFEWVVPQNYSTRQAAEWRDRFQRIDQRSLKAAAPIEVMNFSADGQFRRRQTPPAFQVTDLSFRVITANLDLCHRQ